MSNHKNHRRGESRRTEHGPIWENSNPGKGCNSTHVARARRSWNKIKHRTLRRTGKVSGWHPASGKSIWTRELPNIEDIDEEN